MPTAKRRQPPHQRDRQVRSRRTSRSTPDHQLVPPAAPAPATAVPAHAEAAAEAVPVPRNPSTTTAAARQRAETPRSEEHTSELQSRGHLVCRLLLEKKNR